MATLERLQLLDEERYSRLAEEAKRIDRSVLAIIREAIDARPDEMSGNDGRRRGSCCPRPIRA